MNTTQEREWAGRFGDDYARRSPGDEEVNWRFLYRTVGRLKPEPRSILELGAGTGANLRALRKIFPHAHQHAVEINEFAARQLQGFDRLTVHLCSILDWHPAFVADLVLVKGVLIHINPDHLGMAYETIHRAAGRWILIAEYFNPTPVSVPYRGHEELLWKRDFAGELLDKYKDLRCLDYGFAWKRDTAQDDLTWFLLEKTP